MKHDLKALSLALALASALVAWNQRVNAAIDPVDVGMSDDRTGATCEYFNIGAKLAWKRRLGDWVDARGIEHGDQPFAATSEPTRSSQEVAWDVTPLVVRSALANRRFSFFLRPVPGSSGSQVEFHSREATSPLAWPALVVTYSDGGRDLLKPSADATLDCSGRVGAGDKPTLQVSAGYNAAIEFTPARASSPRSIAKAVLVLTTTPRNGGSTRVGVYGLLSPGLDAPARPRMGIAAAYPGDARIEGDRDVIFAESYESKDWLRRWTYATPTKSFDTVDRDPELQFQPLQGRALRVVVRKGELTGLQMGYNFKPQTGSEPEEIYFRYYLRLANDFVPIDGGKLPGPSGTYDRAGWGGRKPDGTNGWSARGAWDLPAGGDNPLKDFFPLATQISVPNIPDEQANLYWMNGRRGLLTRNRWYALEHYVRMNTPGKPDGIVRGWVDGHLAMERSDVRYRDVADLKIEKIWMNVYHGGMTPPKQDIHVYIDNVVIARRYIGPMVDR